MILSYTRMMKYSMRQKECNKPAAAALISAVYRAPHLSLCVCRTLTLFQGLRHFSHENTAHFAELWHVSQNCGTQKAPQYVSRTNPEANHKSVARFLSKSGAQIFISVTFFLTYIPHVVQCIGRELTLM